MTRVFIYGSCVTRDSEPWFEEYGLEMVGYVARQSVISAFRKSNVSEYDLTGIASSFQRRMFAGDITGNLRFEVQRSKADVVFWDICDERLGVKKVRSGGMVTHSIDYVEAGAHPGPFGSIIRFGDDEHFALWERALEEMLAALARYGLADKLYLNATPWAVEDEFGNDRNGQKKLANIFNTASERYLDAARRKGVHIVTIPQESAISRTDSHKWGPAPFHYTEATYRRMLEELTGAMEAR